MKSFEDALAQRLRNRWQLVERTDGPPSAILNASTAELLPMVKGRIAEPPPFSYGRLRLDANDEPVWKPLPDYREAI